MTFPSDGIRTISLDTLKELLLKSHDDEYVAEMAGCTVEVVEMIRRMTNLRPPSRNPKVTVQVVPKLQHTPQLNNPKQYPVDRYEIGQRAAMEHGSRQLLLKMLETGQHWLDKAKFIEVCHELGVAHRIPKQITT